MSELALAKRYAKALLSLADGQGAVDTVQDEMDAVCDGLVGDALAMLASPCIAPRVKLAAIAQLADRMQLSDLTQQFLRKLIEARRIGSLADIHEAFQALARERTGVVEVRVTSARPLSDIQTQAIHHASEESTGKRVLLEVDVDPSLLAGACVRIGNMVLDGSARGRLRLLGERLIQGTVHENQA